MSIAQRMKPKQLELIVKIAETEQLQLAAQSVAMSQPSASRVLASLESQVGSDLFVRHPNGMKPTQAGEMLVRHARVVLSELATMSDELEHLQSGRLGTVRVGAVTGPAIGHLMPAVQAVLMETPDVRISVDVAPSAALFRGLEEAQYDFILGRANPRRTTNDFNFHPGRSEIVSLTVHTSHPLAGRSAINLAELLDFPWIVQEESSPIRNAVEQAFHSQGLPVPSRVLNSSSLLVALSQVAMGQAIAPLSKEVTQLLMSGQIDANLTVLETQSRITVAPYFVIQGAQRKLSRAAERLLREVMARF